MSNLKDVIPFAKKYIGSPYVFGVVVPKKTPGYKGAFDCAEFVSYCIGQVFSFYSYGSRNGDSYTGYFAEDAEAKGIIITVERAARIPGAILLRKPGKGAIGHIAFSQGNGKTVEAHSTKYGVIESKVDGRRWDYGILLPGIEYTENPVVETKAPSVVYRLKHPMMQDPYIKKIQDALIKRGFYPRPKSDPYFGYDTHEAILKFQKSQGLTVDGEVMPGGETAKALGI